ncbi:hypothetical protein DAPPUDRAFT_302549 [Daphnia pulex]|uniref:Uncharacterized protein n=1 Tax=Daphnia pulex TaxID=6669 RepID=E9GE13_DAPPU|nr:hypothetical protein DAPPUDRAFT_302549 [Daphnia pulex]|eukprot:EFX82188.1 hypothetical protein DAPPUDRAFT_302549 [Daphnia pulex]
MMKGLIIIATGFLLVLVADSAVILHHRIPTEFYLHNSQYDDYYHYQCPFQHYLGATDNVDSRDYYPDVVPRHPLESSSGEFKRLTDYDLYNDIEGRQHQKHGDSSNEVAIPNYRLFHFVLRLVRGLRRHFLPVYATHPDDISNIYAQYNEHELRRMIDA